MSHLYLKLASLQAVFVGEGHHHEEDHTFKHLEVEVPFCGDGANDDSGGEDHDHDFGHDHHLEETGEQSEITALPYCIYNFHIISSRIFEEDATTHWPLLLALCTAAVFLVIVCGFLMYDFFNGKRNRKLLILPQRQMLLFLICFLLISETSSWKKKTPSQKRISHRTVSRAIFMKTEKTQR